MTPARTRRLPVLLVAVEVALAVALAACGGRSPARPDASPLRVSLSLAAGPSPGQAADSGLDSLAIVVYGIEPSGETLLASAGVAIDASTAAFDMSLAVPYRGAYRIVALAFGRRAARPAVQSGLQYYGQRFAGPNDLSLGDIAIQLHDVVPVLSTSFAPPGASGYRTVWPPVPYAVAYLLYDFECTYDTTVTSTYFDWPPQGTCQIQALALLPNQRFSAFSETTFRSSAAGQSW